MVEPYMVFSIRAARGIFRMVESGCIPSILYVVQTNHTPRASPSTRKRSAVPSTVSKLSAPKLFSLRGQGERQHQQPGEQHARDE